MKRPNFYLSGGLLTIVTRADPLHPSQLFLGSHPHLNFTWEKLPVCCKSDSSLGIILFKRLCLLLSHFLYILGFLPWQEYLSSGGSGQATHCLLNMGDVHSLSPPSVVQRCISNNALTHLPACKLLNYILISEFRLKGRSHTTSKDL